jgi:hypothetical protein
MDDLLPCPFCGEEAGVNTAGDVECLECLASGPHSMDDEESIDLWNIRGREDLMELALSRVEDES